LPVIFFRHAPLKAKAALLLMGVGYQSCCCETTTSVDLVSVDGLRFDAGIFEKIAGQFTILPEKKLSF
jgi:hypothetical protein